MKKFEKGQAEKFKGIETQLQTLIDLMNSKPAAKESTLSDGLSLQTERDEERIIKTITHEVKPPPSEIEVAHTTTSRLQQHPTSVSNKDIHQNLTQVP